MMMVVAACADATPAPGGSGPVDTEPVSSAPPSSDTDQPSDPETPGTGDGDAAPNEVFTVLSGDAQRSGDAAPVDSAREALAGFGTDLLRQVAGAEPNTVISPYSLYSVLAMVRAGAEGETARQIDEALHADGAEGAVIVAIDQALDTTGDVVIDRANQVWVQDGFEVSDAYLHALAEDYGVDAVAAAFADAPDQVREAINSWVADQTHDLIPDLFPEGSIGTTTRLALVNALYLKAAWFLPFRAPEGSHSFTTVDGATVETPMMSSATELVGLVGDGWTSVTIPYEGDGLAMTVLVPDAGNYDAILGRLDAQLMGAATLDWRADQSVQPIQLVMPPFDVRSAPDVLDAMKELGVTDLFADGVADLSGIADGRQLFVSDLVHQAVISVDQFGTEAAAASGAAVMESGAPAEPLRLTVDRPFLYWIADTTTGAPLFLGTVTDPTA